MTKKDRLISAVKFYLKYFVRHVEEAVSSATCAHHWHDNGVIPRELLCLVRGAWTTCVTNTMTS